MTASFLTAPVVNESRHFGNSRIMTVLGEGLLAGAVGAAAMTLSEQVEQRLTGRPDSHVPGLTLGRLLGVPDDKAENSTALNVGMHWGQAVVLGAWRSAMANGGLRGTGASTAFTGLRLLNDQTLENLTGSGAPPATWPRRELAIDLLHKAVYGFVTGAVADYLAARHGPGRGRRHADLVPGRLSDVGPARPGPADARRQAPKALRIRRQVMPASIRTGR